MPGRKTAAHTAQQQAGQQDENVSGLEHNRTRRRGDLNFYKVSKNENDRRHYADHHNVVQAEQRFFLSIVFSIIKVPSSSADDRVLLKSSRIR